MKLPWKLKDELEQKEEKIEKLQQKIEELDEEKESWEERFKAEKERRSELSRKKQDAEEKLKRLKDRLAQESKTEEKEEDQIFLEEVDFREAERVLHKLDTIRSSDEDLVTVYSPAKISDLSELRELKNSVSKEKFEKIQRFESFVAFIDPDIGVFVLKMVPFFQEKVEIDSGFEVEELIDFLQKEKLWSLVSAGETELYSEENGEYKQLERITSRVDKEHSKGGFSQGRFERKREEQIEKHLEKTGNMLKDRENVLLLGDRRFCEELSGEYMGGFDPNIKKPAQFYRFRFGAFF